MKTTYLLILLLTAFIACKTEKMTQQTTPPYFVPGTQLTTHYFRINPAVAGDDGYAQNLKTQELPLQFPSPEYPDWEVFFKKTVLSEPSLLPSSLQFCYEALFREYRFYELPATDKTKAAAIYGMGQLTGKKYLGYSVMYNILLWMRQNGLQKEAAQFREAILGYGEMIDFPGAGPKKTGATGLDIKTGSAVDQAMELQKINMTYLGKIKVL
jgi:hypothetical protein